MNRDDIDFANEPVGKLFRRMFFPTLVAMVSMVILNITDGAFVGHGVGSDALAAVNIIAPLFMLMGGIGLMFGIGGSVVASIHLAKGKTKAACINITQALLCAVTIGIILSVLMLTNQHATCRLFGASEQLIPLAEEYLVWIAALEPLCVLSNVGMFMVRLDGSPRFAMWLNVIGAALNIVGDYVLIYGIQFSIFNFQFSIHSLGLSGAAIATSVSFASCGVAVLIYLLFFGKTLHIYRLKMTMKSLRLTLRNLGYQTRIGGSAMLGEVAISLIIIIGNYEFIHYLGEDGVAAYSVGCYLMPIAFMFGNAIVQSSQPIISFAHGAKSNANIQQSEVSQNTLSLGEGRGEARIDRAMQINIFTGLLCGIGGFLFTWFASSWVSTTFLPSGCHAWQLCNDGLPLFGCCFPFVILNLTMIGYFQSTEQSVPATMFTLLRGFIFMLPSFLFLPYLMGASGLWLAIASSEMLTLIAIIIYIAVKIRHLHK